MAAANPTQVNPIVLVAGGVGASPFVGLLDYWFDRLDEAGVRDVLINTHHHRDAMRAYVDRVNTAGRHRVVEAHEPDLLGSAGTIHANRHFVTDGEDCLIVYADNLSDVDLGQMIAVHRGHDDPVTMMLFHAPCPEQCGIAELDEKGRIVSFVEKPDEPRSDLANAGVYAVRAEAYREMAEMNAFDLAFDVLPSFVGRMRGWVWSGYHRDTGTMDALRRARREAGRVFGDCEASHETSGVPRSRRHDHRRGGGLAGRD